jgi:hypothetical protein
MIFFGVGVAAIAIVNPFEDNWYDTGYSRVSTGDTYNAANYVLMGVGGLSILGGLTLLNHSRNATNESSSTSASIWGLQRGAGLRASCRF